MNSPAIGRKETTGRKQIVCQIVHLRQISHVLCFPWLIYICHFLLAVSNVQTVIVCSVATPANDCTEL